MSRAGMRPARARRKGLPGILLPAKNHGLSGSVHRVWWVFCLLCFLCGGSVTATAGTLSAYTKYAGISLSPDGQAFTTDAGVKTYERYPAGYTVYTGEAAADSPGVGEHAYTTTNVSEVRILKWEVAWENARCLHSKYGIAYYHGILYTDTTCRKEYAQGWYAYCADCGERLADLYIYMNSATARGIRSLPGSAEYYYLCPWCSGLEQGAGYSHTCKRVSANGYTVRYDANAPSGALVEGSMPATGHMYGNASLYEGAGAAEAGYGDTNLRPNAYVCDGYLFDGWNTKADGSGTAYADGAAVLNLTSVNGGTVTLYAQWVKEEDSESEREPEADPDEEDPEPEREPEPDPEKEPEPDPDEENPGPEREPEADPDEEDPEETEETEKLVLSAWIVHSRDGYSGDFKSGEGGILFLEVQEYAERIEVIFPEEFTALFPELDRIYVYEVPAQKQEESIAFSVPLYTACGVYRITVKAYREEEEAVVYPVLAVSGESVLNELRTRIRNNQ